MNGVELPFRSAPILQKRSELWYTSEFLVAHP